MLEALNTYDSTPNAVDAGIKFSGYAVPTPFTVLRSLIVEMVVFLVESDINIANFLTDTIWKTMLQWLLTHSPTHSLTH